MINVEYHRALYCARFSIQYTHLFLLLRKLHTADLNSDIFCSLSAHCLLLNSKSSILVFGVRNARFTALLSIQIPDNTEERLMHRMTEG